MPIEWLKINGCDDPELVGVTWRFKCGLQVAKSLNDELWLTKAQGVAMMEAHYDHHRLGHLQTRWGILMAALEDGTYEASCTCP